MYQELVWAGWVRQEKEEVRGNHQPPGLCPRSTDRQMLIEIQNMGENNGIFQEKQVSKCLEQKTH